MYSEPSDYSLENCGWKYGNFLLRIRKVQKKKAESSFDLISSEHQMKVVLVWRIRFIYFFYLCGRPDLFMSQGSEKLETV